MGAAWKDGVDHQGVADVVVRAAAGRRRGDLEGSERPRPCLQRVEHLVEGIAEFGAHSGTVVQTAGVVRDTGQLLGASATDSEKPMVNTGTGSTPSIPGLANFEAA